MIYGCLVCTRPVAGGEDLYVVGGDGHYDGETWNVIGCGADDYHVGCSVCYVGVNECSYV